MKRTDTSAWPCNIARGAHVLGDHWNVLIIRQACLGVRRFDEFQRTLGIGRNILTIRLHGLVADGILDRVEYQASPARFEYRLTTKGRDAYGVLAAMAAWAERWLLAPGEGTPVVLHHTTCGHDMHAVVVCSECAEPIDVRQVVARPGAADDGPVGSCDDGHRGLLRRLDLSARDERDDELEGDAADP